MGTERQGSSWGLPAYRMVLVVLALIVWCALWPELSHGATLWVSPTGGASTHTGADSLTHAMTLAEACSAGAPGDVVRFKVGGGDYPDAVFPKVNGTIGSRLSFVGSMANPTAIRVRGVHLGPGSGANAHDWGHYVTAKWLFSTIPVDGTWEVSGMAPLGDSLLKITCTNQYVGMNMAGPGGVADSLSIAGAVADSTSPADCAAYCVPCCKPQIPYLGFISADSYAPVLNSTIQNSAFTVSVNVDGDFLLAKTNYAQGCKFINNTYNVNIIGVNFCFGSEMYWLGHNQVQGCTYNWNVSGQIRGTAGFWSNRSQSSFNRYFGNTVNLSGAATGNGNVFRLTNAGNTGTNGTETNCYYGYNVIRNTGRVNSSGMLLYYDSCHRDTMEWNVAATTTNDPVLGMDSGTDLDSLVCRHNVFISGGPSVKLNYGHGIANRFVDNIYYQTTPNSGAGFETAVLPASGCALDSAGTFFSCGGLRTKAIGLGPTGSVTDGAPGAGGGFGQSGYAVWGSPRLADSTVATVNPCLLTGSYACGPASPFLWDGFAGSCGTIAAGGIYVSPSGGSTGSDAAHPQTLAWANTNAPADGHVFLAAGTYTDPIQPHAQTTPGHGIVYEGSAAAPAAVIVPAIKFGPADGTYGNPLYGSFVKVRWVACNGAVVQDWKNSTNGFTSDTLQHVTVYGTGAFQLRGSNNVIDTCTITRTAASTFGLQFDAFDNGGTSSGPSPGYIATGNQVRYSTLALTSTEANSVNHHLIYLYAQTKMKWIGNSITLTANTTIGGTAFIHFMSLYGCDNSLFQGNTIAFVNNDANASAAVDKRLGICQRDFTRGIRWFSNTLTTSGTQHLRHDLAEPASYGRHGGFPAANGYPGHGRFENNVVKMSLAQVDFGLAWTDGATSDTIRFNAIAAHNAVPAVHVSGFYSGGIRDSSIFSHNTVWDDTLPTAQLGYATASVWPVRGASNLFYTSDTAASSKPVVQIDALFDADSLGMFYSPLGSASYALKPAGKSVGPVGQGGGYGNAAQAVWNDPGFADSSYASFIPYVGATSPALDPGLHGGYAGWSNVADPPPGLPIILGLVRQGTSVKLSWIAPPGTVALDARYLTNAQDPIVDFASGTVMPMRPPLVGALQSPTLYLPNDQRYYVSIRCRNAQGFYSVPQWISVPKPGVGGFGYP